MIEERGKRVGVIDWEENGDLCKGGEKGTRRRGGGASSKVREIERGIGVEKWIIAISIYLSIYPSIYLSI